MDAEEVRQEWIDRSGEFSPDYYAYYGADDTSERIHHRFDSLIDPSAAILELGCGVGRHLAHLHEQGYRNLSGIDINRDAIDVLADTYPELAATGTFYVDAIETAVTEFDDGQFDAVYSVETLQHIHPDDDWVFEEVARITDDVLVTVEREDDGDLAADQAVTYVNDEFPLYYRNWHRIFTDCGLSAIDSERLARDTLRVFRRSA